MLVREREQEGVGEVVEGEEEGKEGGYHSKKTLQWTLATVTLLVLLCGT